MLAGRPCAVPAQAASCMCRMARVACTRQCIHGMHALDVAACRGSLLHSCRCRCIIISTNGAMAHLRNRPTAHLPERLPNCPCPRQFVYYKGGRRVEGFSGARPDMLEELIKKQTSTK